MEEVDGITDLEREEADDITDLERNEVSSYVLKLIGLLYIVSSARMMYLSIYLFIYLSLRLCKTAVLGSEKLFPSGVE